MDPRIAALDDALSAAPDGGAPLRLEGLNVHVGDGEPAAPLDLQLERGRFAAVAGEARGFDLSGWTLLPGLCDAHLHLFHEARRRVRVDLTGVDRREEIWERLSAAPPQGPLLAVGWDESVWDEKRFPTRAELDRRFPDRPVGLVRVCGHAAVANGRALATLSEEGELDHGAGMVDRETGLLLEGAAVALSRRFPPDRGRLLEEVEHVGRRFASRGMTAVTDMGALGLPELAAELPPDFPLRVEYFHAGPLDELPTPSGGTAGRPLGRKFFLDGSIGGRSAAVAPDYREGGDGALLHDTDTLRRDLAAALDAGRAVALHAIGERALDQVLEVLEDLAPVEGRARLEHVEMGDRARLDRAAALGVAVCMQPNFMDRWGRPGGLYEKAFGGDYRRRFLRPAEVRAAGLLLAYGTDGMPAELLPALAAAVSEEVFGEGADRPVSALAAVTGDAARAAGRQEEWGTVAEGLSADFCLVKTDPCAEHFGRELHVALTVRGGRPTWLHPDHQGR